MGLWIQCVIVESIWDCGVNLGLWSQCGIVETMWDCEISVY